VPVPGQASWTAGAFLRNDWLVLLVASVCLARRGWPAAAGVAIASAAALRLFPALLLALPLVAIAHRTRRRGRLVRFDRRFLAGVIAGATACSSSRRPSSASAWRSPTHHRSTG
jgi:hypothetical protein